MDQEVRGRALLIIGPYGTGKSTVAAEIADVLEGAERAFALLDLDFLSWANPPDIDVHADPTLLLENLGALVANYRGAGVEEFVLAGYVTADMLEAIRATLDVPLVVVALGVPWVEVERRLTAGPSPARADDLREAQRQMTDASAPTADLVVRNDRPVSETAKEILRMAGWLDVEDRPSR